jgi:preprotein translocase subunit SecY
MWEKIRVVFTIPELRQKILLTLLFLAIYRIGWQIPLPVIDAHKMEEQFKDAGNTLGELLDKVAIFSASQLRQATIFGLGIMPYISASIIFQLLASVWKPLENLKKEGEAGQKKINEYTRYATVGICLLQSWFYVSQLHNMQTLNQATVGLDGRLTWGWTVVAVATMTCGTIFLMWLGEQIDEYGIGNGISLLIMAGIVAQMPEVGRWILRDTTIELGGRPGKPGIEVVLTLIVMLVAVVAGVVFITLGQRRIPTQSAKHVRGRRVYGGTRQYLPIRVNQAGVMPIIFASSLLLIPAALCQMLQNASTNPDWYSFWANANNVFSSPSSFLHILMYVALIYFFCYFWTAITFNPKEMSENLKNFGTFIPGYRPGKRTADYLEKVMVRITYVGAGFLAVVAIVPTLLYSWLHVPYAVSQFYGGTGLLIAVSVAFDLVQKIDSHLVMRNYKGLLERG